MKQYLIKPLFMLVILVGYTSVKAQVTDTIQTASTGDSVSKPSFLSKMLYVKPDKKHSHILDYEWGIPPVTYGYNYFYHINQKWQLGARIGVYFFQGLRYPGEDHLIMPSKAEILGAYRIYKSINAEAGIGCYNYFDLDGKTAGMYHLTFRAGVNASIFRFLFVRSGVHFAYANDQINSYTQWRYSFSVGLKL